MDGSPSKSKGKLTRTSLVLDDSAAATRPAKAAAEPPFKAALEDERKQEVEATMRALKREIDAQKQLRDELLAQNSQMTVEHARQLTDEHIDRLHRYNDIKDAGQILFGKLAELKGKTVRDVYEEYNVDIND
ncbi:swi5-like zinc finger protein [Dipsacomyces acuminosporus]|nr:swi5-like zinc finger protein [Dipsacomyces acuminosporus]